jgi:hypothetical protein
MGERGSLVSGMVRSEGYTVRLKPDGKRWHREGKWRGKWRMEWVTSTLHTTLEHGVSSITTADGHTSTLSSWLNWRPRRFKWTRPFRRKTKSGFLRVCHHISNAVYIAVKIIVWDMRLLRRPLISSLRVNEKSIYLSERCGGNCFKMAAIPFYETYGLAKSGLGSLVFCSL